MYVQLLVYVYVFVSPGARHRSHYTMYYNYISMHHKHFRMNTYTVIYELVYMIFDTCKRASRT